MDGRAHAHDKKPQSRPVQQTRGETGRNENTERRRLQVLAHEVLVGKTLMNKTRQRDIC
jgi:hypothetical protein